MKYAIVTYTNSNCKDVWPVYFGQLTKHAKQLKSYVLSDIDPKIDGHIFLKYSNEDDYYKQWVDALKYVDEDYVIYAQEDFILYDDVDFNKLDSFVDFIETKNYSYVRPIRCGFDNTMKNIENDLYEVNQNSDDIFQMQITMWKKQQLSKIYDLSKSAKWYENNTFRQLCRDNDIKGAFTYNNENKRGKYHYDSSIYPYICTAVSRGKWNMNEYNCELTKILNDYSINPLTRGIRKDYNYKG